MDLAQQGENDQVQTKGMMFESTCTVLTLYVHMSARTQLGKIQFKLYLLACLDFSDL